MNESSRIIVGTEGFSAIPIPIREVSSVIIPRIHDRVNGRFLGIEIYGDHEGKLWHRILVQGPLWIKEKSRDAKLWVWYRIHPQHRYNRINLRLPPRYYENDTRLLHGMFAVLCDHVEEEGRKDLEESIGELEADIAVGDSGISEKAILEHIDLRREKIALYDWWCIERPAFEKLTRELSDRLHYVKPYIAVPDPESEGQVLTKRQLRERLQRMDNDLDEKDQQMCHRLVSIRRTLWT